MKPSDLEEIRHAMNRLRAKASGGVTMPTSTVMNETAIVMDAIYRADHAAPASAEPVKIKQLAWRVFCSKSGSVEAEAFGDQYVVQNESEIWCLYRPHQDTPASHHGALSDAKAAVQADFESRIRLTIDT